MSAPKTAAEALAAGVRRDILVVAAHEVSHGIAWAAAGFRPGPAHIGTGWLGAVSGGQCAHGADGRLDAANVVGFLVGCAAGRVGQGLFTVQCLGGRAGGAVDGSSSDRADFAHSERYYRTGLTFAAAERRASELLAPHLAHIERLAVDLARAGRLSRAAFR